MPILTIKPHQSLCEEGKTIEVAEGENICEVLLDHHIEIEHACELSCACTTCHVVVSQGFDELEEADDTEEDMLDKAWGLTPTSRLSCQMRMPSTDLEIEIPKYTLNLAKENH
ncbi:MAG: ISC system 2Fe-2S type ferredoxin [Alcaligenaceae bacterium]|nr:ISC system 2Fe-2S type ferredoxin [Alcaligenaceae bacterium]